MDFNIARIQARWQAGLADAKRTVAQRAWLEPVDAMQGLVIHDLRAEQATAAVPA